MDDENISVVAAARESAGLPFRYPAVFLRCCLIFVVLSLLAALDMAQETPWFRFRGGVMLGITEIKWNFHPVLLLSLIAQISMMVGLICLGYFGAAGVEMVGWLRLGRRGWRLVAQTFKIGIVLLIILVLILIAQKVLLFLAAKLGVPYFGLALLGILFTLPWYWVALQFGLSIVASVAQSRPVGIFDAWMNKDRVSIGAASVLWASVALCQVIEYLLTKSTTLASGSHLVSALTLGGLEPAYEITLEATGWPLIALSLVSFVKIAWITVFCTTVYRSVRATQAEAIVEEF